MEYHNLVIDFAERTQKNLEFVTKAQLQVGEPKIFEVTQLTNSLLGMLIFPQQKFFDKIPKTSLANLRQDGWSLPQHSQSYSEATDLHDLLRHMRNSLTHCNIEFTAHEGKIAGLKMWDRKDRNSPINWEVTLTIEQLDSFLVKFVELIRSINPNR